MKKKVFALLAVFAGLFSVTSCGGGDEPSPDPNPVITLSATQGESDNTAKTVTATTLQTNIDLNNLEVTSSADWCTAEVSKQYHTTKAVNSALSTYYLVVTMTENTGYDDRTASITIQDKNSSTKATYKLIQKKQQPPYVTVSNALMKFLASEATEYNELGTNVDASRIEVTSSATWAKCEIDGNVDISTGKAKLKCHVDANSAGTLRVATITVKVKDYPAATVSFKIEQAAPVVAVSSTLMTFKAYETEKDNTLETNVEASQIEISSSASWASCAIDGNIDSTGKAKLKCKANVNTSASDRTATITVKVKFCPSVKATFKIEQKGIFDSYEMVLVEGGTFTMGATDEQGGDASDIEKPAHNVTLSTFSIGKFEVTQALWRVVMGSNPSKFKGDDLPVENISWADCQTFITKLNQKSGKNYRLPTEAEWEYAARGGKNSKKYKFSGGNTVDEVAWNHANSGEKTHVVGQKFPNELGIYDMSGNVWEWCSDLYGSYPSTPQTNPTGPSSGSNHVIRGGSYDFGSTACRVSARSYIGPSGYRSDIGLRLVLPK